jgi:hypothetical protein
MGEHSHGGHKETMCHGMVLGTGKETVMWLVGFGSDFEIT